MVVVSLAVSCVSLTAPVSATHLRISDVSVLEVTATTATITWTLDKPGTGQVEYGTTTVYGSFSTPELSFKYTTHVQDLSGLAPGTMYHFRVRSTNKAGHETVSDDQSFTTTATATPSPTPTAMPTPVPAPPTGGIAVPVSIDPSGGSDVATALQTFVDGVPDGSTIVFQAGGTYSMSRGLVLDGRHDLVFWGNGATIQATGPATLLVSSAFLVQRGSQGITIRDLNLIGNNPDAGTAAAYHQGLENQIGVAIYGSFDIEIANVTMERFYSDCVYIGADGPTWSERVSVHDSSCSLNGRQGVGIVAARDVTFERDHFDAISLFVVDIEPDLASEGATNVTLSDSSIGSYGLSSSGTSWVLAAEGAAGSTVSHVAVSGNTITGNPRAGSGDLALGLTVTVRDRGPRTDFVVRDNTSSITMSGPTMQFTGVDGVTVTGNRQPLSSGELAIFPGSDGVTYADNDTNP